jgi:hypothetical protein
MTMAGRFVFNGASICITTTAPTSDLGVVQVSAAGEMNWIIKTQGRVWEGNEDADIRDW